MTPRSLIAILRELPQDWPIEMYCRDLERRGDSVVYNWLVMKSIEPSRSDEDYIVMNLVRKG